MSVLVLVFWAMKSWAQVLTSPQAPAGPRLLNSFMMEGVGAFRLFDSDPVAQAESFCSEHRLSAATCRALTAEAESHFFSHQWLLESSQLVLSRPGGENFEVVFDLYSGLGPVLQSFRLCKRLLLPQEECSDIARGAQNTFYKAGRIIFETVLTLSAGAGGAASSIPFRVFDNLSPIAQADDFCLLNNMDSSSCRDIVKIAENAFYPFMATMTYSIPVDDSQQNGSNVELQLDFYQRADPALTAKLHCPKHSLTATQCSEIIEEAELAYFDILDMGSHRLLQKVSFPPVAFQYECHLYDDIDPHWQALRCCDRNEVSMVNCKPVISAFFDAIYDEAPEVSFSLQVPGEDAAYAELHLYSKIDIITQITFFCRNNSIRLASCLNYIDVAESGYNKAVGHLLVPIVLGPPFNSTFDLYFGQDPILQAERFCTRKHITPTQCDFLKTHAFRNYVDSGNELSRVSISGTTEDLIVYDNLDPLFQANHYCEKNNFGRINCGEIRKFIENQYFGAGDLVATTLLTVRNESTTFSLYQNVDPRRQAETFCDQHRIFRGDRAALIDHAKEEFRKAGTIIDIVSLFVHEGPDDTVEEKQLACYDNLDPEIQARNWCEELSMSEACEPVVEMFEATFFHAGEVIAKRIELEGVPFTLRENVDPLIQTSRFCRRNHMPMSLCLPLVEYAEVLYYNYGEVLYIFEVQHPGRDKIVEFTLYSDGDPLLQLNRFCSRHNIPYCVEDLKEITEKKFYEMSALIETFQVGSPTMAGETLDFRLFSNLDPEIQAKRFCIDYNIQEDDCDALITRAEQVYFGAGDVITSFVYQLNSVNTSFVLYNHMDPTLQLKRFFKKNRVPTIDRERISEAMMNKFYEAGRHISSFNISIESNAEIVSFRLYDNLDPILQAKNFCLKHDLSETFCESLVAPAEEAYFGLPAGVGIPIKFRLQEKNYCFNYYEMDMILTKQIQRFCTMNSFSASTCEPIAQLIVNKIGSITKNGKAGEPADVISSGQNAMEDKTEEEDVEWLE